MALAEERGIQVIEDCAQAHGARDQGRSVGSIGHVGAWSFCQDKIMTTGGEGGMVTVNDDALWRSMWAYKDHGKSWKQLRTSHPPVFRWLHESFGTHWRMPKCRPCWAASSCADGRLDRHAQCAREADPRRPRAISNGRFALPRLHRPPIKMQRPRFITALQLFLPTPRTGWSRDRIVDEIRAAGVPAPGLLLGSLSEKAFRDSVGTTETSTVARELAKPASPSLHPTLTDDEMRTTGRIAARVLASAARR